MESLLQADTRKLKQHEGILQQEWRTAQLLVEQLRLVRSIAPPELAWQYDSLIEDAGRLSRYFRAMGDQVDYMGAALARLSLDISMLLDDTLHRAQCASLRLP